MRMSPVRLRLRAAPTLAARVVHPGLDGVARDADDLRDILRGPFVIVDEVDDLAVLARQPRQAPAQDFTPVLALQRRFQIVARSNLDILFQCHIAPAPDRGHRLVAGDGQEPGRGRRAPLEPVCVPPRGDERFAGDVLGQRPVAHEPQDEAVDPGVVARIQDLHRRPVAASDPFEQCLVRLVLARRTGRRRFRGGHFGTHWRPSLAFLPVFLVCRRA